METLTKKEVDSLVKEFSAKSIFNEPVETLDCTRVLIYGYPDTTYYMDIQPINFSKFEETENSYKVAYTEIHFDPVANYNYPVKVKKNISKKRGYIHYKTFGVEEYVFFI